MGASVKAKDKQFSTGGLYGSAVTTKHGTTYNPTDFEKKIVGLTTQYIPQYLEQMANPTYDSEIFKAQTAQRNRLANQSFENNLINPLANRGLTRGSSINQMSGQFANKLADLEVDAMAQEDQRMANNLNNMFNYYQIPFNMMMDISNFSNNQYQQGVQAALREKQLEDQARVEMIKAATGSGMASAGAGGVGGKSGSSDSDSKPSKSTQWGSLLGAGAGYAYGGPIGGQVGANLGGMIGSLWD